MNKIKYTKIFISVIILFSLIISVNNVKAYTILYPNAGDIMCNVTWVSSPEASVSGFSGHVTAAKFGLSFNVDGKQYNDFRAFCSDHNQAIPMNSPYDKVDLRARIMNPGDADYNKKLATAVYYGMNGLEDVTKGLPETDRIGITAYACSYAKNGDDKADELARLNSTFALLKQHIDAEDAPSNVQYFYAGVYAYKVANINGNMVDCAPWTNDAYGVICTDYQWLSAYWGRAPMGKLYLNKVLDTTESGYATVGGAEYGVYSDSGLTKKVATLTTDNTGKTNTVEIVAGTYYIKETKASQGCLLDGTTYTVNVTSGTTTFVNSTEQVSYKLKVKKSLIPIDNAYGDAKLNNAVYGIYETSDCSGNPVATLTTDENGNTQASGYLKYKTYYAKELTKPTGTVLNDEIYTLVAPKNPEKIGEDYVATFNASNEIIKTTLKIIKSEDNIHGSEENPAVGAVLKLTLDSNSNESYTNTINKDGYCEFTNIPYGTYTLSEVTSANDKYLLMDDEKVNMFEPQDEHVYHVIVNEEELETYLKIRKIDADSNKIINLEGARFKIYDVDNKRFVSQLITPSGEYIDEFETNEDGIIITPQKLEAGNYVIYETKAPSGYYLNPKYNTPKNDNDLGDATKNGVALRISTQLQVDVIEEDTYVYTIDIKNEPLKAKLSIQKKGEMLTETSISTAEYKVSEVETRKEDLYTPIYKEQGLKGVEYTIYAAKDIKSPDGTYTYVKEGTQVDKITTQDDGVATSKELYPGEYRVVETKTPNGYLVDENISNQTLKNEDSNNLIEIHNLDLTNDRQKLEITFPKRFDEVKFSSENKINKYAVFGIYTNQEIKDYKGNIVIPKNKLVDYIEVNDDSNVTSKVDLPEGKYYVKELYASFPYTPITKNVEYTLSYNGNSKQEFVVFEGEEFLNKPDTTSVTLVKLSSSIMDNLLVDGNQIDKTNLDKDINELIEKIQNMTKDEIKEYFETNDIKVVPGATYGVYTDKNCSNILKVLNEEKDEFEDVKIVTDNSGMITLENIPLGKYYIKELVAPAGYEITEEVIEINLTLEDKDTMIFRALKEDSVINSFIKKTDIFTGEVIPECVFTISDENDNVILRSKTSQDGIAYIPLDILENGKVYYFTEIEAPKKYKLNTEKHKFVASYNEKGEWTADLIEVSNTRKESTVTLTKLDMVDSTPIPNCKFVLQSLENPDWKVEGVTDENGIYVFENVPYGEYTYTELEAPEEYLIDTTPHEITIDEDDVKIVVKDDRAPDTGDINLMVIAMISTTCIVGIIYCKNIRKFNI